MSIRIFYVLSLVTLLLTISVQALTLDNYEKGLIELMNKESFFQVNSNDWEMIPQLKAIDAKHVNSAFYWAVRNGRVEVFNLLLNDSRIDAAINCNCALELASKHGHTEIVKMILLQFKNIFSFEALRMAVSHGHVEVMDLLLERYRVDRHIWRQFAIQFYLFMTWEHETVEFILNDPRFNDVLEAFDTQIEMLILSALTDESLQVTFPIRQVDDEKKLKIIFSSAKGDAEELSENLIAARFDESLVEADFVQVCTFSFVFALLHESSDCAGFLLYNYFKFINIHRMNEMLKVVLIVQGQPELIRVFLNFKLRNFQESRVQARIELAALDGDFKGVQGLLKESSGLDLNYASFFACMNGHLEVVKMLHEMNGSMNVFGAMFSAGLYGQYEVAKFLLTAMQEWFDFESIISFTAKNGHYSLVKLFLGDARFDPSELDNLPVRMACRHGRTDIVRILLKHEKVDPSDIGNYAIRMASKNGHTEIVKMLLEDYRVDPSVHSNFAIKKAVRNGHREIVSLLLKDRRVQRSSFRDTETPSFELVGIPLVLENSSNQRIRGSHRIVPESELFNLNVLALALVIGFLSVLIICFVVLYLRRRKIKKSCIHQRRPEIELQFVKDSIYNNKQAGNL